MCVMIFIAQMQALGNVTNYILDVTQNLGKHKVVSALQYYTRGEKYSNIHIMKW